MTLLSEMSVKAVIPVQSLPKEIENGQMFEVVMGDVKNPHNFNLQLRQNFGALSNMMDELDSAMEEKFQEEATDENLPPPEVCSSQNISRIKVRLVAEYLVFQVGMYVAARWRDEMWYRAQVIGFHSRATVRLHYIDYGSVVDVDWWKVGRNFRVKQYSTKS